MQMHYDLPKKQAYLFCLFLLLYEISAYLSNDMIMPGMLSVVRDFSASEHYVSLSLTAFILGGASLQLILGPLTDRFRRKPVMLIGVGFFFVINLLFLLTYSIDQFIVLRFFQGMGLCFISVVGYATLQEICADITAVRITSIMGNITVMAPLAGPLLGVLFLSAYPWQIIFIFIAFTTAISFVGLWLYMPDPMSMRRLDGTVIQITLLKFTIIKNNYLLLMRNPYFIFGSICLGLSLVPLIAWIGTSPIILMKAGHMSLLKYGLLQVPIFVSAILGTVCMRYLLHFYSLEKLVFISSISLVICLFFTCGITYLFAGSPYALIVGLSCYLFMQSIGVASLTRLVLFSTSVPKGTASALMNSIEMILFGIGNQIGGMIYYSHSNFNFSLFCVGCGVLYSLCYWCGIHRGQVAKQD